MPFKYNPFSKALDYFLASLTGAEIVALLEALGAGNRLSHTKLDDIGASDHHAKYTNGEADARIAIHAAISGAHHAQLHAAEHVTGGGDIVANAVPAGNAGLMTGADKTKLDGCEANSKDDQSGAEIVALLEALAAGARLSHDDGLSDVSADDHHARYTDAEARAAAFVAATVMLFGQSAAPTEWTKKTDWTDNSMLIYTTGDIAAGGSDDPKNWTTALVSASHTLATAGIPSHRHQYYRGGRYTHCKYTAEENCNYQNTNTGYTGGGGSHSHTLTQDTFVPKYQTVIAATKD